MESKHRSLKVLKKEEVDLAVEMAKSKARIFDEKDMDAVHEQGYLLGKRENEGCKRCSCADCARIDR